MERRTFLSAGSVSVLAFAAGPRFTADDALSNDPADVVRAYYRRASVADTEAEFADTVPELAHSASPLLDVAADIPEVFEGTIRQDLDEISGMSDFFAGSVSRRPSKLSPRRTQSLPCH